MERLTSSYRKQNGCVLYERANNQIKNQQLIDKLAEYEDAEEQGQLLRLPCKVGDTVYVIVDKEIYPLKATERVYFILGKLHIECESCRYADVYSYDDFGKTLFLTREEAEQALEQMKGE